MAVAGGPGGGTRPAGRNPAGGAEPGRRGGARPRRGLPPIMPGPKAPHGRRDSGAVSLAPVNHHGLVAGRPYLHVLFHRRAYLPGQLGHGLLNVLV